MSTPPKPLPTCPCGNTNFEKAQATIPLSGSSGATTMTMNYKMEARIRPLCGQVTFWNPKR